MDTNHRHNFFTSRVGYDYRPSFQIRDPSRLTEDGDCRSRLNACTMKKFEYIIKGSSDVLIVVTLT